MRMCTDVTISNLNALTSFFETYGKTESEYENSTPKKIDAQVEVEPTFHVLSIERRN